jgi:hypothetical protein
VLRVTLTAVRDAGAGEQLALLRGRGATCTRRAGDRPGARGVRRQAVTRARLRPAHLPEAGSRGSR